MENFLSNPLVIQVIVTVLALVIAKFDKTDTIANLVKKLGEKLSSQ